MVLIVRSEWRGRGCSHGCSVGGSWEYPRLVATNGWGESVQRGGSSALPCIFSTHRWMSPMPRGTITTGSETALCLQPTLCPPCWPAAPVGRAPAPPSFFQTAPLSLPRSHNQCKGCSRDLRWFLTSPPLKFNRELTSISLPHVASFGFCRPGATLGAAASWSYPLMKSSYRCPSWAGDGSSWIL